jgi:hypothetical protein
MLVIGHFTSTKHLSLASNSAAVDKIVFRAHDMVIDLYCKETLISGVAGATVSAVHEPHEEAMSKKPNKYIEGFGFTKPECATMLQAYNGIIHHVECGPYRDQLLGSISDLYQGLDTVEEMVDEGAVLGDSYENMESIDQERDAARALLAKVARLTEAQAREVHGYCIGFWDGMLEAE